MLQIYYAVIAIFLALASARKPSNAILLSKVKTLTLQGDKLTAARRLKAIPQLKCIGGTAKGLYDVDVMRCKNSGSEYDTEDISWTCQASLPPEFKLGSTEVVCEGYDNADDPYVLKGSCGVEYRLLLTDMGEAKYGKSSWASKRASSGQGGIASTLFSIVFWMIFMGIVLLLAYKFVQSLGISPNQPRRPRRPFTGNFGGGGGPGNDDDPPPPYSRRPPKQKPSTSPGGAQNWRPGFWSGTAAGAAAGYAMGARNANRNAPAQAGPSNWFNTGARNTTPGFGSFGAGPSQSSASAPSSSRYESTGFGSTRRR